MKDYKKNYSIVPTRSANDMSRLYYTVTYHPTKHTFEYQFFDEKEAKKFINELVEMNNFDSFVQNWRKKNKLERCK